MRASFPDARLLLLAALLQAAPAVGVSERPRPDGSAIEEVLRGAGQPQERYVSARAVEHYLRARLALEDGILERAEEELSLASVYDPRSAWPRYAMALEHLRHGESQEAEKDLRVALQIDPQHVPSLRLRARVLLDQGRVTQALTTLRDATRIDPRDPELWALRVQAHLARQQLPQARAAVEQLDALASRTQDGPMALAAQSHLALAQAFEAEGRFDEAEVFYRRSLDRQPGELSRVDALVRFLEARRRFDEAARLAARSLALTAPHPSRLLRVARLQMEAGQPKTAAAYVRLAAESDEQGQDLDALVTLGAALLSAQETQVALEAFEAVLSRASERDDARWYAALANETLGRFEAAIEGYRRLPPGRLSILAAARAAWCEHRLGRHQTATETLSALVEASPDDEDVLLLWARVHEGTGQAAEAMAEVEKRLVHRPTRRLMLELAALYRRHQRGADAVALLELERRAFPNDQAVAWSLAQSLAAAGRTERAIAEAKSLLARHPERGDVANFVAWLLAEQGRSPQMAENFAWLALELEPDRWEYLDTLGWAQLKAGKITEAVETLEKALAKAPDELDVALHLAEALVAARRPAEAVTLLKDITGRTRAPALAVRHERASRLLEGLAAATAPTADATQPPVAP